MNTSLECTNDVLRNLRAEGLVSEVFKGFWFHEVRYLKPIASPTVYFLVEGNEVLYVGSTINIKQRWSCHHLLPKIRSYRQKQFRIFYLTCNQDVMFIVERLCIEVLKPRWNRTRQENVHQENKRLKARIAEIESELVSSIPELRAILDHWENECVNNPDSPRHYYLRKAIDEIRALGY